MMAIMTSTVAVSEISITVCPVSVLDCGKLVQALPLLTEERDEEV